MKDKTPARRRPETVAAFMLVAAVLAGCGSNSQTNPTTTSDASAKTSTPDSGLPDLAAPSVRADAGDASGPSPLTDAVPGPDLQKIAQADLALPDLRGNSASDQRTDRNALDIVAESDLAKADARSQPGIEVRGDIPADEGAVQVGIDGASSHDLQQSNVDGSMTGGPASRHLDAGPPLDCPTTVANYCASSNASECTYRDYQVALWEWNQLGKSTPSNVYGCGQSANYNILEIRYPSQSLIVTRYFARSDGALVAILRNPGDGTGDACVAGPSTFTAEVTLPGGACLGGTPPDAGID
jgi:hypothetical protein